MSTELRRQSLTALRQCLSVWIGKLMAGWFRFQALMMSIAPFAKIRSCVRVVLQNRGQSTLNRAHLSLEVVHLVDDVHE